LIDSAGGAADLKFLQQFGQRAEELKAAAKLKFGSVPDHCEVRAREGRQVWRTSERDYCEGQS